jgi:hypothetical protein
MEKKMQIDQLTGVALDWVVTSIEQPDALRYGPEDWREQRRYTIQHGEYLYRWHQSWNQGGPIIEREKITIRPHAEAGWTASLVTFRDDVLTTIFEEGPTPLIAAMRCYVASCLGDEVEVPDLIGGAA